MNKDYKIKINKKNNYVLQITTNTIQYNILYNINN